MSSAMQCHSPFNFSSNCKNKAKREMNIHVYKVLGGIEASGFLYSLTPWASGKLSTSVGQCTVLVDLLSSNYECSLKMHWLK